MRYMIIIITIIASIVISGCNQNEPKVQPSLSTVSTIESQTDPNSVKVGVLSIRSAVATNAQYGPIIAYLETEIGRPFELVFLEQETQFTEVEQHQLDFVFSNPLAAVQLRRLHNTEFLVTLSRINTGTEFGGLIIVSAQSDIKSIEDLHNKRATCVAFETAAAGCAFQILHLQQQGFNAFEDFASFIETDSQDNIVLGILNGTYDVGFIRTGQLERMVNDGTLLFVNELHIIDQVDDSFFFPHTTILYPEWPFAALSETSTDLKHEVTTALLAIPPDHPALVKAGSDGFVETVDYSLIDELIVDLKLRSWDSE